MSLSSAKMLVIVSVTRLDRSKFVKQFKMIGVFCIFFAVTMSMIFCDTPTMLFMELHGSWNETIFQWLSSGMKFKGILLTSSMAIVLAATQLWFLLKSIPTMSLEHFVQWHRDDAVRWALLPNSHQRFVLYSVAWGKAELVLLPVYWDTLRAMLSATKSCTKNLSLYYMWAHPPIWSDCNTFPSPAKMWSVCAISIFEIILIHSEEHYFQIWVQS